MARLYLDVIRKEQQDGTYRPVSLSRRRQWKSGAAP
jgi:hypothetical protein